MATQTWPHPHLPHAMCDFLKMATIADQRVTTLIPRERTYPLLVVRAAGLGPFGTDPYIQADEIRLQTDSFAERLHEAMTLDQQVFRLLDKRFTGALKDTTWLTEDEESAGEFYETKIERVGRAGGGQPYFDEFAKVHRVTSYYNVKVNL